MIRFLEQTKREQQTRLSGNVPGLEEYWSYRMGTSAVGVIVAALEYAMREHSNVSIYRDKIDVVVLEMPDSTKTQCQRLVVIEERDCGSHEFANQGIL
ncbi:hypothetical protein HBH73_256010 [Parastagonospora nodorum]|nr:hypothetical protein HBH73_256010 [Parastagonospora nodorum]